MNLPETFREDRKRYLSTIKFPEPVFIHGDLHHGNIIIDKQGNLTLIDFGDSLIAPHYYEWKYYWNNDILKELCFGEYTKDEIYEIFTVIYLIDWYGAPLIEMRTKRLGIDFTSITSVNAFKDMIIKLFNT